jgi:SAM-dependent methyltransferase
MDSTHAADCWGRLNEVADVSPVLTILRGLPDGFRVARRAMLAHLKLRPESRVLEAGCGPGTGLPDLLDHIGTSGRIIGLDPTHALIDEARAQAAQLGATNTTYAIGDIRQIEAPDGSVDAAFCDKILVHVSPVATAVGELARVTRRGGRVGVVEWYSQGMMIASSDYETTRRIMDGSAPQGALNPIVPLELESVLASAGLANVEAGSVVAETHRLVPGIEMMLSRRVQQAVDAGALPAAGGQAWLRDLKERDARQSFYWAAVVRWAVGSKATAA